jgi:hypothetical protein
MMSMSVEQLIEIIHTNTYKPSFKKKSLKTNYYLK